MGLQGLPINRLVFVAPDFTALDGIVVTLAHQVPLKMQLETVRQIKFVNRVLADLPQMELLDQLLALSVCLAFSEVEVVVNVAHQTDIKIKSIRYLVASN